MPGQARAIGAWTSDQCLTNSSCEIPGFRASSEARLIIEPPCGAAESALQAIFAAEADAASPAKPIRVRRRDVRVTLLFEDMRRSPKGEYGSGAGESHGAQATGRRMKTGDGRFRGRPSP